MFTNSEYRLEVESNVFDIPQRVKEYDSSLFVVFNARNNKFEIHSTENIGSTYCFTVPFDELDNRTLELIKKGDTRNKSPKELEREFLLNDEMIERKREEERKNWIKDVSKEVGWHFTNPIFSVGR